MSHKEIEQTLALVEAFEGDKLVPEQRLLVFCLRLHIQADSILRKGSLFSMLSCLVATTGQDERQQTTCVARIAPSFRVSNPRAHTSTLMRPVPQSIHEPSELSNLYSFTRHGPSAATIAGRDLLFSGVNLNPFYCISIKFPTGLL
jgi:hypothetical protein